MSRYIKYQGKLVKFADKLLKMAEWIYNEGVYYLRVKAGGGTVANRGLVEDLYKLWEEQGRLDNIRVAILPQAGSVQRTSGIYRFFSKLFTLRTDANDVTQATANSQPYVVNGAMVNPNGASRFMTHPTVSFGAGDAWSVSFMIDTNGRNPFGDNQLGLTWAGTNFRSTIAINNIGATLTFFNDSGNTASWNFLMAMGKRVYFSLIAAGDGTIVLYRNGVSMGSKSASTVMKFRDVLNGYLGTTVYNFYGNLESFTVESGNPTPTQILEEYNLLRSYIPEIATTLIGTDEIATENCQMVATPMGRVIRRSDSDNEKIPQPINFLLGYSIAGAATINDANTFTTTGVGGIQRGILTIGNWYKLTSSGTTTASSAGIFQTGAMLVNILPTLNGSVYFQAIYTTIYIRNAGAGATDMTAFSVSEINFQDATDFYNYLISQGSTVSNALLAAAMWRSPDSDHDKQAVFGKIYNDYAAALMRFDIAAYNTANPSTPWGYHVMTRAEEQALAALDADTLKSNDLWTSTNGTNETGLSLLGTGVINADGTYSDFGGKTRLMTGEGYALDVNDDGTSTEIAVTTEGGILRLVKD